ncbi:hypothetical protein KIW84_032582 [Lathyrus oleraceus]|uniref:Uncharacterized protein n=1 Tax=Pisum sativum TaxID=3888 RepID=A0A9D5AYW6_PEA|nr:hypothetical protein KIW84_032582 [Pisum sativum]
MLSSTTSTTSTNEKVDDQDANPQNMDKEDTTDPSMSITEPMLGRGHRIKQPSTRLQHYVTNTARRLSSSNCSLYPKATSGAPYPITNYVNYDHFSIAHRDFLSSISQEKEPINYTEAMKDSRWREAMQSEIHALETNGTWTDDGLQDSSKIAAFDFDGCLAKTAVNISFYVADAARREKDHSDADIKFAEIWRGIKWERFAFRYRCICNR